MDRAGGAFITRQARQKTRFKRTTDSDHNSPIASNLLDQDFSCDGPDQKWGVVLKARIGNDISYIWTAEGWLYLAIVLDLFSRRIVGWDVSDRLKKGLAMNALQRAISLRQPSPGVIHHSDRGSQYCSGGYQKLVAKHGFAPSMSGKGNCYDCDCGDSVQDNQIRAGLAHQLCQPPGRHQGHWQLH